MASSSSSSGPLFGPTGNGGAGNHRTINLDDIFSDCFFGPVGEVIPSTSGAVALAAEGAAPLPVVPSTSAASGGGAAYDDRGAYEGEDDEDDEEEEGEDGKKRKRQRPQMRMMTEQQKVERRCVSATVGQHPCSTGQISPTAQSPAEMAPSYSSERSWSHLPPPVHLVARR